MIKIIPTEGGGVFGSADQWSHLLFFNVLNLLAWLKEAPKQMLCLLLTEYILYIHIFNPLDLNFNLSFVEVGLSFIRAVLLA